MVDRINEPARASERAAGETINPWQTDLLETLGRPCADGLGIVRVGKVKESTLGQCCKIVLWCCILSAFVIVRWSKV